jgi:plasmid stabilization system protein ParE
LAEWGLVVANNFVDRFKKVYDLLAENPAIYRFIDRKKQIQKCVVTKHNGLYFIETENFVKIITVFDTRQNPKKLRKLL